MQDFNKNAFPLGWLKMIRKYEVTSMHECIDEECCDKAENVDKEVININSDKFDIDVWKVFTREKLIRQKERAEKEKACADAIKEIKEEIGFRDEDHERTSPAYKLKKECTESWLPKEELEKYKKRYKDIRDEQDLVMSSLINLSFPNDFMKGSYVQQYKQLEAQKMIIVDTIMNSYCGKTGASHHLWNDNLTEKDQNTVYAEC